MSRAAILSFSARGGETARRIADCLQGDYEVECHTPKGNLKPLTAELFPAVEALIFVGACGIAVRAIAPHLVHKAVDPAVLVADERGDFVISLISGHIGGANDLARQVAAALGGTPVITTATDVNRRFSADAWAARQGLVIESLAAAKRFSAEILKRDLPLASDFPVEGALPAGLVFGNAGDCGLAISCRALRPFAETLLLIPRKLRLGIGCKRGTPPAKIAAAVDAGLAGAGLCPQAVAGLASIDVKRDEVGLAEYAGAKRLPLEFFSAAELNAVPGEFTASEFVKRTVGVDNVCERAALRAAGDGAELIVKKTSLDGVTVAVAREKWSVSFE